MTETLQREIDKYLSKKLVLYAKFSDELKTFLSEKYKEYSLPLKLQWQLFSTNSTHPICEYKDCQELVSIDKKYTKFSRGCCKDHSQKITFIENYGEEHPLKNKKQQAKLKNSVKEKYGVDSIAKLDSTKEKIKKTTKEKYDVDSIAQLKSTKDKIKNTMLERYGVEHAQQSEDIRLKTKQTNLLRFGVEEPLSDPTIRAKGNETNLERYGSIFPMKNKEVAAKKLKTIIDRYDGYSAFSDPEVLNKVRKTHYIKYYNEVLMKNSLFRPNFSLEEYSGVKTEIGGNNIYSWRCISCKTVFDGSVDNGLLPSCPSCFPKLFNISKGETELYEMIEVPNKKHSVRGLIGQKEIDIYLPDHHLGIEFNGLYWHSEQKGKGKYYHLDKTLMSENNGFDLIHVFENEWINSKDFIMDVINRRLGKLTTIIDISLIDIKTISNSQKTQFLKDNSIFGDDLFAKNNRGLFLGDELLAVMSTSKLNNGFEVRQYVIKIGVDFGNGNPFEILFKSFNISGKEVSFYVDRRFGIIDDNILIETGFTYEGATEPLMYYSKKNDNLISASSITQSTVSNYIKQYDKLLTVKENMIANGYLTIWDCGKLVFKKY